MAGSRGGPGGHSPPIAQLYTNVQIYSDFIQDWRIEKHIFLLFFFGGGGGGGEGEGGRGCHYQGQLKTNDIYAVFLFRDPLPEFLDPPLEPLQQLLQLIVALFCCISYCMHVVITG